MIQGRTMQVPFVADIKNADVNIDKGANFLFIKAMVDEIAIDDLSGYPYTNTKPWCVKQRSTILRTLDQRTTKRSV